MLFILFSDHPNSNLEVSKCKLSVGELLDTLAPDLPFYQQWWFLVIVALIGTILVLIVVMILYFTGRHTRDNRHKGEDLFHTFTLFHLVIVTILYFTCWR